MKTKIVLLSVFAVMMLFNACKKDGRKGPDEDDGPYNYGPGAIFIKQGTEGITKLDMSSGEFSSVMSNWPDAGWDISWDGTKGVKQVNVSYYDTRYIIFKTSDGSTLKEVSYESVDNHGGLPYISPDGTKLALRPMLRDGLIILDMAGNVLKSISGYGTDHTFEYLDPINWAADGTILFKKNNALWRTSQDLSRAFKIKDIPFSDWRGDAVGSPDGQKIAMSLNGHIWLMNLDGSNLHQVTESNQKEVAPSFSPDSRYIAIKANSRAGDPGSGTTAAHLCLIPADGQVYKVYPGEDNRVIHPRVKGATPDSRGLGVTIVGDFVWR